MFLLSSATVNLSISEENTTRTDIDCPGDTVSFTCFILPNKEGLKVASPQCEYEFVGKHLCFYVPTNNYYREEELSYQSQVEKVISLWSRYSVCLKQAESQLHLLMHCCTVCIEFILTGLCIMPYAYYVLCIHGQVKWFSLTIVPSNLVPYSIMCMYIQMYTAN